MKKLIIVLVSLIALTGCTTVQYAKNIVDEVCTMDPVQRTALKSTVDAAVFPHLIRVECDGQLNIDK